MSVLTLISFLLRVHRIDTPGNLIGDEIYYVPAARNILGWNEEGVPQDRVVAHPPLGKMIIALGMLLFGDNPFGWRITSVLAGTACVPLFFLVVRRLLQGRKEFEFSSMIATFLFAFENLTFYFARVARLDVFMLVFLLAGIYFLLDERLGRKVLSTPFFAASLLSKEAALVVITPMLLYSGLRKSVQRKVTKRARRAQSLSYDWRVALLTLALTGGLAVGLWYVLEWVILVPRFSDIFERVLMMVSRLNIRNPAAVGRSEIWQWFFNYPVTKAVAVEPGSGLRPASVVVGPLLDSRVEYSYYIVVSWTIILPMIPAMVYTLFKSVRDDSARVLAVYWFGGLLGWIAVNSVFRELVYLFYILPLLPPVIIAISQYLGTKLVEEWRTKSVKWTGAAGLYLLLHLVNFVALYPVPIP